MPALNSRSPAADVRGMTPSAADIYRCLLQIVPAAEVLPRARLTGAERQQRARNLQRATPSFVRAVCRALRDDPELFDGLSADAGALGAQQERALAYFWLHGALQRLAEHARDCYVLEQSGAMEQATAVVRWTKHQLASPAPCPRRPRLAAALRITAGLLPEDDGRQPRRRGAPGSDQGRRARAARAR